MAALVAVAGVDAGADEAVAHIVAGPQGGFHVGAVMGAKVENFSKLESRKSKASIVDSRLRVATVGKLLQSRRVGEIPLSDIVCIIVGVVVDVRCDHIFGLILIAKVVFTEKDA